MRDTFSARGSASQTQPAAAARSVEQDRIARAAHEQATPRRACQWLHRHRANGMGLRALPEEFAELLAVIVGHAHLPRVLMHRLDHASVPLPARTHTSEQQQQHRWLAKHPPAREAQRLRRANEGGWAVTCPAPRRWRICGRRFAAGRWAPAAGAAAARLLPLPHATQI